MIYAEDNRDMDHKGSRWEKSGALRVPFIWPLEVELTGLANGMAVQGDQL